MSEEPATIIIAGGGIVGLSLGMAIQKQLGVTPEIYEKTSTFATEAGAGLGMYPNGLRVIRDISPELLAAVRRAGFPYQTRRWERHDGTEIMKANESVLSQEDESLDSIGIRRSSLQKVLYNFALFKGIVVHFKMALTNAFHREDGLIQVEFSDGTTRLTKVLFGADGALGKARSIVAGENEPGLKYTGVTCLMGLAKSPADGICFPSSNEDDFHAVFFPTAKNEQCFQFHVPVPEEQANTLNWGNLSQGVSQEECRKIARHLRAKGWHNKYIEPLDNVIQAVRVGFALLEPRLTKWVRGRIALVGDAAHPPVPYVGQGAQQGLEDAGVVVSLLKIYCMDSDGNFDPSHFEKAMTMYQEVRIKRSSQILDFSKSLGSMQARRATSKTGEANMNDNILKGEVLMYGTLPVMMPGAGHDYKDDVKRVTQDTQLPAVAAEEAIEALSYLLGLDNSSSESNPESNTIITSGDLVSGRSEEVSDSVCRITAAYKLSEERVDNLVDWLVEGLKEHLKRIVAHNESLVERERPDEGKVMLSWYDDGKTIVDEVSEVIELPPVARKTAVAEQHPNWVFLSPKVVNQLKAYVAAIAKLYRDNPFHNFEHACNVTVAVSKFLTRMAEEKGATLTVDDRTFGIASDPLTQFSCVFAALLHDCDHEGVPNAQLLKEHPRMARAYKNQAIAEQHSVDVAFEILMEPKYRELRNTIYASEDEMRRFRQLIVNIVIATDICDKELKDFRNKRWQKAFADNDAPVTDTLEDKNRRATIGIETLIQASDISHTMSPWHVYRQWNERLFAEMYKAYIDGRSEKDPSDFWYKGEIGFYDFYIIPLAKKLQQCEVFGSNSEECLNFAMKNRQEWELQGMEAIDEMIEKVIDGSKPPSNAQAPTPVREFVPESVEA